MKKKTKAPKRERVEVLKRWKAQTYGPYVIKVASVPPKVWQSLEWHPLADLAPYDAGAEPRLIEDLKAHGFDQSEPVVVFEVADGKKKKIVGIDGRLRLAAAIKADVKPCFAMLMGDPLTYVAKKLARQHLSDNARAMMAAKIANMRLGDNQHTKANIQESSDSPIGEPSPAVSQAQAADLLNVSKKRVERAVLVEKNAIPALKQAVADGHISMSDGVLLSREHSSTQSVIVDDILSQRAKTAKEALDLMREPKARQDPQPEPTVKPRKKAEAPDDEDALFDQFDDAWQKLLNDHDDAAAWEIVSRRPDLVVEHFKGETWGDEYQGIRAKMAEFAQMRKAHRTIEENHQKEESKALSEIGKDWAEWRKKLTSKRRS